jgi:hypothetical protein
VLAGLLEVLHLQLHGGHPAPVAQHQLSPQPGSWDTARSARPALDGQVDAVGAQPAVLDHGQHQRRGAHLEVGRDLREVGVADDHVQPPVLVRVGVRLVAGVDDRPLQRGLEPHLDLEEVGPLADLEAVLAPVLPMPTRPRP